MKSMQWIFMALLLCLNPSKSPAAESNKNVEHISISGIVENGVRDTLQFELISADVTDINKTGRDVVNEGFLKFTALTNPKGFFQVNIPMHGIKFGRLGLLLSDGKQFQVFTNALAEQGDQLFVRISKQADQKFKVKVYGQGSAKYRCSIKLNAATDHVISEIIESAGNNKATIEALSLHYNDFTRQLLQLLSRYKKRLTPAVYKILKADVMGTVRGVCLDQLAENYSALSIDEKNERAKLFRHWKTLPDNIFRGFQILSTAYLEFLRKKSQLSLTILENRRKYSLTDLYFQIHEDYKGETRDYLLFSILYYGDFNGNHISLKDHSDSLWKFAAVDFSTAALKKIAVRHIDFMAKGMDLMDFSMPDTGGKIVHLKDLAGKVVVIDVWFTGCKWCKVYSSKLDSQVYPVFRKDSNVVFLSICGDKEKQKWLTSIKSGQYSNTANLNLYTDGLGFMHPFTMYYDIDGGPYSMIIDRKGKFYAADPTKQDMPLLISMIREALAQ